MTTSAVRSDLASFAQAQYSAWRQSGTNTSTATSGECGPGRKNIVESPHLALLQPAASNNTLAMKSYAATLHHSAEVEITTAEGDRVKVGFNLDAAESSTSFQNYEISSEAAQRQLTGNVSFVVEGDISEKERTAIHDLLTQVDAVAGQFFHGDVNAALGQALRLGVDGTTLAQFTVKLSASATQAVSAYQQTSSPTAARIPDATHSVVKELASDVAQIATSPATTLLADAHETLKQLMGAALVAHAQNQEPNDIPPPLAMARNAHDLLALLLDKAKAQAGDATNITTSGSSTTDHPASRNGDVTTAEKTTGLPSAKR